MHIPLELPSPSYVFHTVHVNTQEFCRFSSNFYHISYRILLYVQPFYINIKPNPVL